MTRQELDTLVELLEKAKNEEALNIYNENDDWCGTPVIYWKDNMVFIECLF